VQHPFACDVCKKSFKHSGVLKVHLLIHTGQRPFTCDVCKKSFRQSGTLKMHLCTHTGERPYICDVRKKNFQVAQKPKRASNHIYLGVAIFL